MNILKPLFYCYFFLVITWFCFFSESLSTRIFLGFFLFFLLLIIRKKIVFRTFIYFICFCLCCTAYFFFFRHYQNIDSEYQLKDVLVVVNNIKKTNYGTQYEMQALKKLNSPIYQVFIKEQTHSLKINAIVKITCEMKPLDTPKNNFLFFVKYGMYAQKKYHQCFHPKIKELNRSLFIAPFIKFKNKILQYLNNRIQFLPDQIKSYAYAFILGDSQTFEITNQKILIMLGIIHIYALSGSHIRFLEKIFSFIFAPILKFQQIILDCFCLFICFYGYLLSHNLAFFRSVCFFAIHYFLSKKGTEPPIKTRQLLAFLLTQFLFYFTNPYTFFHLGFQFSSVGGFLMIYLDDWLALKKTRWFSQLIKQLACSFYLLPIIFTFQNAFFLFSLFMPLFLNKTIELLMVSTYILFFIPTISFLFSSFFYMHETLIRSINHWNITIQILPFFTIQLVILIFIQIHIFFFCDTWKKKIMSLTLFFYFILGFQFFNHSLSSIHFLSLPYGETIILKIMNKGYIIDTGGHKEEKKNKEIVDYYLLPYLEKIGINRIEELILTHDDIDHSGAAPFLLKKITVAKIYVHETSNFAEKILEKDKKKIRKIKEKTQVDVFTILPGLEKTLNENNRSLIIYGHFFRQNWIFMADTEKEGELYLLKRYPNIKADIIKIGHHGSKTSSTKDFLTKINPKYAIITVPKNNFFHHPHKDVIERLKNQEIKYWQTDIHGSQSYYFNQYFDFWQH